MKVYGEAEV